MVQYGTVVNGVIVPDGPPLPEGMRVKMEPADVGGEDEFPLQPPTDTYEEHIESLRQSIEETKAGIGGVDARQFLKELAIKYDLPLQPGE